MAMDILNNILNQTFNDAINLNNNREINTSEHNNVKSLFTKIKGFKNECNICYSDELCLQCYQCEFKYCETCLTKVISEFTKCSACQVNLLDNYNKILDVNKELIKKLNIPHRPTLTPIARAVAIATTTQPPPRPALNPVAHSTLRHPPPRPPPLTIRVIGTTLITNANANANSNANANAHTLSYYLLMLILLLNFLLLLC